MSRNIAASIRQRLLNLAKERKENFDYVLRQYVIQRLLYRLSVSEYRDQFLLKGAMLFWVWNQTIHRPTRDIDLLGFGSNDVHDLNAVFADIVSSPVTVEDGLVFDAGVIQASEIKEDAKYQGVRVTGFALLEQARIPFQVDIGFGDAVTPRAEEVVVDAYLDLPAAHLGSYPVYTVVAEKFQAMIDLGVFNSRMKDFFDVWLIATQFEFDERVLAEAISATFDRRGTAVGDSPLTIFSEDFKNDRQKETQWRAFLRKNSLPSDESFSHIVSNVEAFLLSVYRHLSYPSEHYRYWNPERYCWE